MYIYLFKLFLCFGSRCQEVEFLGHMGAVVLIFIEISILFSKDVEPDKLASSEVSYFPYVLSLNRLPKLDAESLSFLLSLSTSHLVLLSHKNFSLWGGSEAVLRAFGRPFWWFSTNRVCSSMWGLEDVVLFWLFGARDHRMALMVLEVIEGCTQCCLGSHIVPGNEPELSLWPLLHIY